MPHDSFPGITGIFRAINKPDAGNGCALLGLLMLTIMGAMALTIMGIAYLWTHFSYYMKLLYWAAVVIVTYCYWFHRRIFPKNHIRVQVRAE